MQRKVFNLSLRAATLFSKFALIFVLAKFLEPRDVALYGLIAATVSYVLMAVGFDFYAYSTREMLVRERREWSAMLRDQGAFFFLVYVVVLPLTLLVFVFGFLPWSMLGWFLALLVLEHLCQELNRVLVAMSEPLWASVVFFIRSGAWAVAIALVLWLQPAARELSNVLLAWSLGAAVACLLGLSRLWRLDRSALARPVDWGWIRRGLRVAVPLLAGTLALRGIYTFDRYWMESFGGVAALAAYVLFAGIANAMMNFLDAGVFAFKYPALVRAAGQGDLCEYEKSMRDLVVQTCAMTGLLAAAAIACAFPLVAWLDKSAYVDHFGLIYPTVLATVIFSVSMIPHYGLYARRKDGMIIASHLLGFAVFSVAAWMLSAPLGGAAVPAAMCIAFLFVLLFKSLAYLKSDPYPKPVTQA